MILKKNFIELCSCGINLSPERIVGGADATPNSIPWQVGLIFPITAPTGTTIPFCGGTIIDSWHILTAAHCLYEVSAGDFYVIVAEHDASTNDGKQIVLTE